MFKQILFAISLILCAFPMSCSEVTSSDVFTGQVTSQAFVSELNSSTLQTIRIHHQENSQIAWAKLMEDQDFRYFTIERVTANNNVVVQDGVDGFETSSRALVPGFSISATEEGSNTVTEGTLDTSTQDGLTFRIRFAPQAAQSAVDEPFHATLAIYYTAPQEGLYLVDLEGYVQGVRSDKCTQNISSYEIHEYNFVNGEFGFYFCSPEVASTDNANAPERGASTNFSSMPIDGNFYFYQPDDETVCLMHAENIAGPENPTLPDFDFLIPDGLAEVDSLPITLFSTATCDVSAEGQINCPEIQLDTLISLSPMRGTTGTITAEENTTDKCPDFGEISGSGALGDDNLTFVVSGQVYEDEITSSYNIQRSVMVGVIELQK